MRFKAFYEEAFIEVWKSRKNRSTILKRLYKEYVARTSKQLFKMSKAHEDNKIVTGVTRFLWQCRASSSTTITCIVFSLLGRSLRKKNQLKKKSMTKTS